jgi:hypothetical protein
MEVVVTGHNFESILPKDHPCHVCFKLADWFQKRRLLNNFPIVIIINIYFIYFIFKITYSEWYVFCFFLYKSTGSDDEQRTSFSQASFQRRKVVSNWDRYDLPPINKINIDYNYKSFEKLSNCYRHDHDVIV